MANYNRLQFATVMSKAFGTILDTFSAFSTPTQQTADLIILQNLTDASVMVGIAEEAEHIPLPANGYIVLDLNRDIVDTQIQLARNTEIYVKRLDIGVAPTVGSIYISIIYSRKK